MIRSLGLGELAAGGRKNTGSAGVPTEPKSGPRTGLQPSTWAAQGSQDTGAWSRLLYWPRGSAQGGARRPERAVPGKGPSKAGAAPGMAEVWGGPGTGTRHDIPTVVRGTFIYNIEKESTLAAINWPPPVAPGPP